MSNAQALEMHVATTLRRSDWSMPERIAFSLLTLAVAEGDLATCVAAYGEDEAIDHDDVDAFVGHQLAAAGHTVAYSDDGHIAIVTCAHVHHPGPGLIERYRCGAPDCGNHLGERTYYVPAQPLPIAGGSGPITPVPTERPRTSPATPRPPGIRDRRSSRKRARQNRSQGRR